jgi:Ca2+-dependent lipid-binding protein
LRDVTDEGPFDLAGTHWANPPPKKLSNFSKVRVSIYQCESLPPADSNGTSDPYIEVWTPNDKSIRTKTQDDTNNPIFYEVKEIDFEYESLETAPPIILRIYDTDAELFDSTDDFIGQAVIFLTEVENLSTDDKIPYP